MKHHFFCKEIGRIQVQSRVEARLTEDAGPDAGSVSPRPAGKSAMANYQIL